MQNGAGMDIAHRFDALRTEGEAALRAAEDRLDVGVPHLEWTVGEVVAHLGGVHRRFATSLRHEVAEWPDRSSVAAPSEGLVDWARDALHEVVRALGAADLGDTFTTWAGPRHGNWVLRRITNETAVHRWDVEAAVGTPDPIDADLAIEVTEEFLTVIVADRGLAGADGAAAHDGATLHLHATDHDAGEWFITVGGDGLQVEHRHDKGDVAVRGSASDLALWLNGRLPISRLDTFGEAPLVDWWAGAFTFD